MEIVPIDGGPFDCNIYMLRQEGSCILVDAGTGIGQKKVHRSIEDAMQGSRFLGIALTHEHFDHSGGAKGVQERFGGRVWCSEACAKVVGGEEALLTGSFLFGEEFDPLDEVSVLGDDLTDGPFRIRVVPTPGHSKGSVCLFDARTGALFPGDLVFCDGGVGRWDLPGGDLSVLRGSVRTVMGLEVRGLFPGHGRMETADPAGQIRLAASTLDIV